MKRERPLILNIDDDEAGRYAVGRSLKVAGFDVMDAGTGESGLRYARENQPDLILLDIHLPDIDGFEVCRQLRANPVLFGTPVLQMSASYLDVSSRVRGLENGADAYLTEPVEPTMLIATINSLLRMKRAETTVRQIAGEWQSTFDAIGEGVALLDNTGHVTRANHAFDAFHGLEKTVEECFGRLREQGDRQACELVVDERTISVTLDPVRNEDRELTGSVCVVCDVTDKKIFDAQMRQTARLESIGVLAGGIAHDFNNLLTGILGNANLLLETMPANAPDREMVLEIVKSSESAADLTRQILAYSGKGRFIISPIDLSLLAQESRTFVRRFIPAKVELTFDTKAGLPVIEADSGQMQQVLMNLIINAAESIGENQRGSVHVSTSLQHLDQSFFRAGEANVPGDYVTLVVTDTGSGMDADTQGRIFDPFFTTKFTGRGLGLSAVHGILKAHKGYLRLESAPGQGTTFRLYFPVSEKAAAVAAPVTTEPVPTSVPATVLIVDDEPIIRSFARTALERRGYKVLIAEDGQGGVEAFREKRDEIQVVVLDYTMPVMDGEEALEKIRGISPGVPVILSSGFSEAIAEDRFSGKGLSGFLGKPFTATQLSDAINAALNATK